LFAFLLNLLLQQWAMVLLGRGLHRPVTGTIFELVRMTPNLLATLTLFKKGPQRFSVTPKGRTGQLRQRISPPRILTWVLAASCVAAVVFLLRISGLGLGHYPEVWVAYGAAFWLCFNAWLVWLAISRVKSMRFASEVRRSVRFPTDFRASLDGQACRVVNASLNGVRVLIADPTKAPDYTGFQLGQTYTLTVELGSLTASFQMVLKLVKAEPENGGYALGGDFLCDQFIERAALSRSIFALPN
jgi:hypothetical protein